MLAAGGSARACAALLKDLHMIESTKEEIPCEKLQELITYLNREDAIRIILRCEPERIHTFFPGLLILYSTANYYGCKRCKLVNMEFVRVCIEENSSECSLLIILLT